MTQNETQREKKTEKTWTELQWGIHYLDLLSVHKFDNLDEMETFLEGHNLQRGTQEEIDYLDKPILWKGLNP